jgi:hypothetical protein
MNRASCVCVVAMASVACDGSNDIRSGWEKVLSHCASTDLVKASNILYFGPSNTTGPGSVFRKAADADFRIRWPAGDLVPPAPVTIIVRGADSACSGSTQTNSDFGASLSFSGQPTPISAGLQADFKKASSVDVQAGKIAWDTVAEGPYKQYVDSLPGASGAQKDLFTGQMLVLYRALRVSGYAVALQFSSTDAANLQAKYSGPQLGGALSAGLNATWGSNGKLTLSASSDFYIAGQLVKYTAGGFAEQGDAIAPTPIDVGTKAKATIEHPSL